MFGLGISGSYICFSFFFLLCDLFTSSSDELTRVVNWRYINKFNDTHFIEQNEIPLLQV